MSRGKYLSLEEARNADLIRRFCKEHETKGNEKEFDRILGAMSQPVKKLQRGGQTSKEGLVRKEQYSPPDILTRRG